MNAASDMKKQLVLNTIVSLMMQVTTVICGFVLPRLMLSYYGSEVNGLVQSIAQFLGVISFMELGVGQVIQSSLYHPLEQGDVDQVSRVLKSGSRYFQKIAFALFAYMLLLCLVYPKFLADEFSWLYTVVLIIAMGGGYLAQYCFGLVDRILLSADQKGYIQFIPQIVINILNVVVVSYLISRGNSIQTVKLFSAALFLLSPIFIRVYIKKHYKMNREITYDEEPIKQKWNGVAQHISNVVLEGTDVIVLTLFSTLSNVSIYSVYLLVISGVRQLYTAATVGIQSMIGALWAKNDKAQLERVFHKVEMVLHFVVVYLFSCIAILIVPFVKVYTLGIADCNYIQPLFALILTLAFGIRCLRTPYNILVLAGGHYKQTQNCHIIAAVLNIVVSVIAVLIWGLVGIAIGTLVSFTYQTAWIMVYNSKNLLNWSFRKVAKQLLADLVAILLIYVSTMWVKMGEVSYISWFVMAIIVAVIAMVVTVLVAVLFFSSQLKTWLRRVKR